MTEMLEVFLAAAIPFWLLLRLLDWLTVRPFKLKPEYLADMIAMAAIARERRPTDLNLTNLEAFQADMLRQHGNGNGPEPQVMSGLLTINEARAEAAYKPIRGLKTDFVSLDEDLSRFGMFVRDYLGDWHIMTEDCLDPHNR